MSTRTGFPRMDWDTGFLADPKFQHLRDLLPDPIRFGYAGFCFLRLTADAWRTCKRQSVEAVVRGIEPWAVEALVAADLLDIRYQLPQESFDKWVGAALDVRQTWREKKAKSPGTPRDSQGSAGSLDTLRIGTVGKVGTDEGVQGEPDAFEAFHARTGQVPGPKLRKWLNELTGRFGEANVAQRIAAVPVDDRIPPDYLRAIAAELAVQEHRAERAERADEVRRIEEKRRPIKILPTPVTLTPEEADRMAREYIAESKAMRS